MVTGVTTNYDWFDDKCNGFAMSIKLGTDNDAFLNQIVHFLKTEGRPANKALLDAVKVSTPWAKKIEEFPELKV